MEVKVMKNILGENDKIAADNRKFFAEKNITVINLMGSPGSGKTSLLEKTLSKLAEKINVAVIEGDLFTVKDAERIERQNISVVQYRLTRRAAVIWTRQWLNAPQKV